MMQGDPKVDELMRPVNAAIRRHVKNGDAVTDIYNRAYEALMISMDVKAGKTYCAYCAYCGAEYPLDDNAAAQVSEHIKTCEKHPMRAVEARAEAAEARVHELQAALADIAHGPVGTWNEPQHAAEVIKHMMRVASDALKGGEE